MPEEPQEAAAPSAAVEPVARAAAEEASQPKEVLPLGPVPAAPAGMAPASVTLLPQSSPRSASVAPEEAETAQGGTTAQQQGTTKNQRRKRGKKNKK